MVNKHKIYKYLIIPVTCIHSTCIHPYQHMMIIMTEIVPRQKVQIKDWNGMANDYFAHIISPFYDSASKAKFFEALDKIVKKSNSEIRNVFEAGCGNGYLLPYLSNRYPDSEIIAADNSVSMVQNAKVASLEQNISVDVMRADTADLPFHDSAFDAVYAINSLLDVSRQKRGKMMTELYRVMRQGAALYALFPSNENFLDQAYALKERKTRDGEDEHSAVMDVYTYLASRNYDPIGGFIDIPKTELRIKLYSSHEIADRTREAGFKSIKIRRFTYPKSTVSESGLITTRNGIYDWLVRAEK